MSQNCYVGSLTKIMMQDQTPATVRDALIRNEIKAHFRNGLKFGFLTFYIVYLACKLNSLEFIILYKTGFIPKAQIFLHLVYFPRKRNPTLNCLQNQTFIFKMKPEGTQHLVKISPKLTVTREEERSRN